MKRKLSNAGGITLIALVITIIILLILAGVTISLVLNGGIITQAQNATEATKDAQNKEKQAIEDAEIAMMQYANKSSAAIEEELGKVPESGSEWAGSVKTVLAGVPIPKGFSYLTGTKSTGLVIIDTTETDTKGNEFVWVPSTEAEFVRNDWGRGNLAETSTTDKYWEDKTTQEYQDMVASVKKYGGFYIARYEASFGSGTNMTDYKPASKKSTTKDDTTAMSYTAGRLWNFVSQVNAIKVSKNMYAGSESVESHLIYGVQWDRTLQWLMDTENKTEAQIKTNSKEWGQYTNSKFLNWSSGLQNTGYNDATRANNIYDLAGNLREWTQEKHSTVTTNCANRGGSFDAAGSYPAVSRQSNSDTYGSNPPVGLRPALYLQ